MKEIHPGLFVGTSSDQLLGDDAHKLHIREMIESRDKELAALRAERDEYRKALENIVQYLHDTDELGQEYLTPRAKEHYDAAHAVLTKHQDKEGK